MKKFLLSIVTFLVLFGVANAQGTTNIKDAKPSFSAEKASSGFGGVNEKAVKDFRKNFKTAMDANWAETTDGSIASFNSNGIKTKVAYNKNGTWQHTIRYYGESNLPEDVRSMVKSNYYDYSISQVEEITLSDKIVYLVHVDGKADRRVLRIADGEMQVVVNARNQK